ncbi:1-aminocyclopropane-1-carboxylate synthase [Gracilaria domingensis]|nr:1-aminocyclopropane-1-carboxylate synthase [Gracilaria domingensis]
MSLSGRGEAIIRDYLSPDANYGWHLRKVNKESEDFPFVKNLSPVANRVSLPIVRERLASLPTLPSEELTYDYMNGSQRTRELIAHFLSTKLLDCSVSRDQVVVLDGQTSVLNAIAFCLCEEGDRVLVLPERMDELTFILGYRAKVEAVPVSYLEYSNSADDVLQSFEASWQKSGAEGSRIRFVYVASSDVYGEDIKNDSEPFLLDRIVTWASSKGIHTVVDITNALNVATDDNTPGYWNTTAPREDVHIIWNASRFLNIPGASLCALTTRNKAMLNVFGVKLSYFGSTSRQSQWIVQHMLSNADFIDSYVEENRRRVIAAHQLCLEKLEKTGIPYRFASAGCPILLALGDFARGNLCLKRLISNNDIIVSSRSGHVFLYYGGATSNELDSVLQDIRACMLPSE